MLTVKYALRNLYLFCKHPKANKRDAKLFVAFRPNDNIKNEVSVTPGYEFNKNNSVTAASGKNKFKFDIKEQGFAWIADNKIELKMIKQMRKGSRIMITGYNQQGSQTIDSLLIARIY